MNNSWQPFLQSEASKPYYNYLQSFLESRRKVGSIIYPPEDEIFNAFELTPLDKIKVVILGQDPYHGVGQAHGLCFSVRNGNKIPPSLRNIFKELNADLGFEIPLSGELTNWAKNGVFLLNTILTVEQKSPASHQGKGWETFTDAAIRHISDQKEKVVFILWGAFAQKKTALIDEAKHLILKAPHPAAEVYAGGKAGFFGSKPFSKANAFLDEKVNWELM
jgi:uracil-DNA glycosylase